MVEQLDYNRSSKQAKKEATKSTRISEMRVFISFLISEGEIKFHVNAQLPSR